MQRSEVKATVRRQEMRWASRNRVQSKGGDKAPVLRQTAMTAYFTSAQLPLFTFALWCWFDRLIASITDLSQYATIVASTLSARGSTLDVII